MVNHLMFTNQYYTISVDIASFGNANRSRQNSEAVKGAEFRQAD
jgi:hypothetical protein